MSADDEEWEPETAELRRPGDVDVSSHARRNLEQLWQGALDGDCDVADVEAYRDAVERFEDRDGGGGE